MYKDGRYINAGQNEIYRYGHKAVEKVEAHMSANEAGFISIPADGGKYWTIGTSEGKYGEFARIGDTCFSVNKAGNVWAKEGTEKAELLLQCMRAMISNMNRQKEEQDEHFRSLHPEEEEEQDEERD